MEKDTPLGRGPAFPSKEGGGNILSSVACMKMSALYKINKPVSFV